MRAGYSYGTLDYKTNTIPTLGASNSVPHTQAIIEIERKIKEATSSRRFFGRK